METIIIQVKLQLKWQFKNDTNYKVSTCKKVVNCRTGKLIKKTLSGRSVGFNIKGNFYKLSNINDYIELIQKVEYCPFSNNSIILKK